MSQATTSLADRLKQTYQTSVTEDLQKFCTELAKYIEFKAPEAAEAKMSEINIGWKDVKEMSSFLGDEAGDKCNENFDYVKRFFAQDEYKLGVRWNHDYDPDSSGSWTYGIIISWS